MSGRARRTAASCRDCIRIVRNRAERPHLSGAPDLTDVKPQTPDEHLPEGLDGGS
jgi:hypothetical protein